MDVDSTDMLKQMGFADDQISEAMQLYSGSLEDALAYLLGDTVPPNRQDTRITELDISQYTFNSQGSSSCTAAAIHSGYGLLKNLKGGLDLHNRDCLIQGVEDYNQCVRLTGVDHMGAEEFLQASLNAELKTDLMLLLPPMQKSLLSHGAFQSLFMECRSAYIAHISRTHTPPDTHIIVAITRPPETITVLLPVQTGGEETVALVDSHSRPQLGLSGAYLVSAKREDVIIDRLQTLFPPSGVGFTDGDGVGLMEEMYNTIEGTVLCLKNEHAGEF